MIRSYEKIYLKIHTFIYNLPVSKNSLIHFLMLHDILCNECDDKGFATK